MAKTAKAKIYYVCRECGSRQLKWMGKCPDCGQWDSFEEERIEGVSEDLHRPMMPMESGRPVSLAEDIDKFRSEEGKRYSSGMTEFDRVLGGGLVDGATILLGGPPGIGKSTLLLQSAQGIANTGRTVMYVTSEESPGQIKMRAGRLGLSGEKIIVDAQTNLEVILNHIREIKPAVVMIDSVQLIYKPTLPAAPGSVSQLRQCGTELVWLAKSTGTTVLIVGHVTKEGTLAGPKILEHIVDVVLYFEGDYHHSHRLVRAAKNRFGATNELGIFEMSGDGLLEITDPAGLFLQDGPARRAGSVILSASEGTRILLVEVQGLTAPAPPGMTRRKATGVDGNRLAMILAVLERHCRLKLSTKDVFVNVVGGVKIGEPAADLAIAVAVAGAYLDKTLPAGISVFGEIGLSGELRSVPFGENRVNEALRLGLSKVILPSQTTRIKGKFDESQIIACQNLNQVLEWLE
jgi:DNA repair protein RadA/Sms